MPRLELPGLLGDMLNVGRNTGNPRGAAAEWTVTILLLLSGTTSLVQAFVIPTGSMEDTLLMGGHVLVDKPAFAPPGPVSRDLLRFSGDISLTRIEKKQWPLNSYRDNFPSEPNMPVDAPADRMLKENVADGQIVVSDDHYFAPGGNRDSSPDSRYWGLVPRENIIGNPLVVSWSYDTDRLAALGIGLDHIMDLAWNFFSRTRWKRTFKLIRGYPTGR